MAASLLLLTAALSAQGRLDTLSFSFIQHNNTKLQTVLDKQINTYNLNVNIASEQVYRNLFFSFSETYFSTLIKTTPKNIKDEQYLNLLAGYNLSDQFSAGMILYGNILSDNRKIGLSEASNASSSAFVRWRPFNGVYFAPYAGYLNSKLIGENDKGAVYGMEALAENLLLAEDFTLSSAVKFGNEDITPRKNYQRLFRLSGENVFGSNSRNVLNGYFTRQRKDIYFEADSIVSSQYSIVNNIQSRTESNYYLQDQYNMQAGNFIFDMTLRSVWKDIDRSTRYKNLDDNRNPAFDVNSKEFRLEFESATQFRTDNVDAVLRFGYSEREEQFIVERLMSDNPFYNDELTSLYEERSAIEKQKNNKSVRALLSLSGSYTLTKKDMLSFSVFHSKLKYDTPSQDNYDDRDELLSIFRLMYLRKLTPLFDLSLNLEGSLNHTVYIYSQRSSNNSNRRIIRFSTAGDYRGSRLTSRNTFEVSANYTVYDFEDINPNYRSFSFRQLLMSDSSEYRITRRLSISTAGYLRMSEQGEFNWKAFSGRPTRDLSEVFNETRFNLRYKMLHLAFGYRYLNLKTYTYSGKVKSVESDYTSMGPVALVDYPFSSRLQFRLNGSYEFITYEKNRKRNMANMYMQVAWRF